MAERRRMANALSPEKVAFLRGEHSEPQPSTEERRPAENGQDISSPPPERGRITITVRLDPDVAEALARASAQRKMKRLEPYTQQDITGDALKQWLREAGFWPPR